MLDHSILGVGFCKTSEVSLVLDAANAEARTSLINAGIFSSQTDSEKLKILCVTPMLHAEFPQDYYHARKYEQTFDSMNGKFHPYHRDPTPQSYYSGIGIAMAYEGERYLIQISTYEDLEYIDLFFLTNQTSFFDRFNTATFSHPLKMYVSQLIGMEGPQNGKCYSSRSIRTLANGESSMSQHLLDYLKQQLTQQNGLKRASLIVRYQALMGILNEPS